MHAGDVVGQLQGSVCSGSDPTGAHGVGEQLQPTLEVRHRERALGIDEGVAAERVPDVALDAQQCTAPEGGELGQVLGPVHLSHVVEHGSQQIVLGHVLVEPAHHLGDLLGSVEVTTVLHRSVSCAHATPSARAFSYISH